MTAVDASSGWTVLIPGFVLAGAGVGMINPPLASTAIGVVHHSRSGMASGINNTFRQVGIATGIAGLGAVFQHEIQHNTTALLHASGATGQHVIAAAHGKLATALVSGDVGSVAAHLPPLSRSVLTHAYRVGFTDAFSTILTIAAAVAFAGALAGLILVRGRDFVTSQPVPGGRRAAAARGGCGLSAPLSPRVARIPCSGAPAGADSAGRKGPRASAGTARTPSRGLCAPPAGARTSRTGRRAERDGAVAAGPARRAQAELMSGVRRAASRPPGACNNR